jgi:perosamine synthetase
VRARRTQPPVGYRLSPFTLGRAAVHAALGTRARDALEQQIADHFGVQRAFALSSGKAALTTILRALHAVTGRRRVVVPAYTCYSVPSAIMRAGLIPVPCDVARGSFDYDFEQLKPLLGEDILCALSVHLFGIASDTSRLKKLCAPHRIFVVEDAAQAMGGGSPRDRLGTRGDAGFFSVGRGKNVTCGGGGLIVTNEPAIIHEIEALTADLPVPGRPAGATKLLELAAMSIFISPRLYWLPAGTPALKLGETIYDTTFPIHRLSDAQAQVLADWSAELTTLNAIRRAAGAFYRRSIPAAVSREVDVPYLRFPLVTGDRGVKDLILRYGRELGIGTMYPGSLSAIPDLRDVLDQYRFPEAERVAASLVTLPTHPLLTGQDRLRICEVVNAAMAG